MKIDIERLRKDLKKECYGAYFGGGFGGAMMKSFDVEKASPQELVEMTKREGLDLRNYEIGYKW